MSDSPEAPARGARAAHDDALALEERLGHRFARPELLDEALSHRSWAFEQGMEATYERLEFLGDAVLDLLAAEHLFREHPELPEGELSKRKAALVTRPSLARAARRLGIGEAMRLGVGEERSGGRTKDSLLADVFESVLGAVYLDGGLEAARRLAAPLLATARETDTGDAKTRLQELTQARGWELPVYRLVSEAGPDHAKTFRFEVLVDGRVVGSGEGGSKKLAEIEAAAEGLRALADDPGG